MYLECILYWTYQTLAETLPFISPSFTTRLFGCEVFETFTTERPCIETEVTELVMKDVYLKLILGGLTVNCPNHIHA